MKTFAISFLLILSFQFLGKAQSLESLKAIDAVTSKEMSLLDFKSDKGTVIIFFNPDCPFAKMYASRILSLREKYQALGFKFLLVHPESGVSDVEQTELRSYIDDSGMRTSFLIDQGQTWIKQFQITKIPETVILKWKNETAKVMFKGAIDNNPQAESAVTERFLERALNQQLKGESPLPAQVRAVGCNIRQF